MFFTATLGMFSAKACRQVLKFAIGDTAANLAAKLIKLAAKSTNL